MSWITGYGCTTAAGKDSEKLWCSLLEGRDHSASINTSMWPGPACREVKAYSWQNPKGESQRSKLGAQILLSWAEAESRLDPSARKRLKSAKLGVVLASTKGFVDDFIWDADASLERDALSPLLDDFIASAGLEPERRAVISNACASSLSAFHLAEEWLTHSDVTDVIVIAADAVGPFVIRGFDALKILTPDAGRPFSRARSGFHLGEAAAAIVVSKYDSGSGVFLRGAGVDAEGFAVTRPSQTGESLRRACLAIENLRELPPDFIVAHGTGTQVNDKLEAHVYSELFAGRGPLITGTKWCVGHTLGACGAVDVIAAIKAIEANTLFTLANTAEIDSDFQNRFATSLTPKDGELKRALICSLGFGGVHAAALVEKRSG